MEITIKNYRCFPDTSAARFSLREGLTGFIGVNNSGKSSLLKFFYEFRHLFALLENPNVLADLLRGASVAFNIAASVFDIPELFSNSNDRDLVIEIEMSPNLSTPMPEVPPSVGRITIRVIRDQNKFTATLYAGGQALQASNEYTCSGSTVLLKNTPVADAGLLFESSRDLTGTLYAGAFRNVLNVGSNDNYFDIKTGEAFVHDWRAQKTGNVKRQAEATYRLAETIRNIFDYDDLQIDAAAIGNTLQVAVNGRVYKLPEVGSGMTQFILVLANVAIREPSYLLIDEPELNLHPSLQLDFITALASFTKKGVLFSTHSIGLARAAADRIYSVKSIRDCESKVEQYEKTPSLAEFLGELSFSGYRELGFDRVLLVEGPKDIKTIQQLLRLVKKDHKVVLLPLGGASLINASSESELAEITRISTNVSALVDSERGGPNEPLGEQREAFRQTCEKLGITCHILQRRAIENYLPVRAVTAVKGPAYRALGEYEKLGDISPSWAKEENWRIAAQMTIKELRATDLGAFLQSL